MLFPLIRKMKQQNIIIIFKTDEKQLKKQKKTVIVYM